MASAYITCHWNFQNTMPLIYTTEYLERDKYGILLERTRVLVFKDVTVNKIKQGVAHIKHITKKTYLS